MRIINEKNEVFTVGICKSGNLPNYLLGDKQYFETSIKINDRDYTVRSRPNLTEKSYLCFEIDGVGHYVIGTGILDSKRLTFVEGRKRIAKAPAAMPTVDELLALSGKELEARTGMRLNGKSKRDLVNRFLASKGV